MCHWCNLKQSFVAFRSNLEFHIIIRLLTRWPYLSNFIICCMPKSVQNNKIKADRLITILTLAILLRMLKYFLKIVTEFLDAGSANPPLPPYSLRNLEMPGRFPCDTVTIKLSINPVSDTRHTGPRSINIEIHKPGRAQFQSFHMSLRASHIFVFCRIFQSCFCRFPPSLWHAMSLPSIYSIHPAVAKLGHVYRTYVCTPVYNVRVSLSLCLSHSLNKCLSVIIGRSNDWLE